MNNQSSSLKNNFLISMPMLGQHKYPNSVIYICHQGEYGSMGIIINQEYDMDLYTMLQHLHIHCDSNIHQQTVYHGGDVQNDRGFILHPFKQSDDWLSSYRVSDSLSLTSSVDILEAMAVGLGPKQSLVALGYIGWGPGELESEIIDNLWLNCPVNLDIIFSVAAGDKMQAAASSLGVSLERLTSHSGKA
ncbi:MAG: YqgE/AlgH family protein [Pseudomonadales bacterium]|nr:YqgE/AlgH family protein [Pseudomonadales bacterium]NRA16008.1 YqgE/AlgH family protein [Oceanospirillaceae bacterium]